MKKRKRTQPARAALIYMTFGILWIILSDSALGLVFQNAHQEYALFQTIKGWLFVCASALLIYVVLRFDRNALMESEQRYKFLFDSNPHPMWVYDMETLRFLMVNDAALDHYGYTREEFLGMTIKDIRPAEDVPALLENTAMETASRQRSGGWKHLKKDGSVIDVEILSHALDFEGKPARLVLANDITERKQAEDALRESEAFIKAILDNLPIGIAVNSVDPAVTFNYMNDNFPRFYRTSREELSNPDAFWEAVYEEPGFREENKKRVLDDCASGDAERMVWANIPIARKGERTAFITAQNVPIPGKSLMISMVWDITERKQAEEQLRLSEERFRQLAENIEEGFWITDPHNRQEVYLSPANEKIWGRSLAELMNGKNVFLDSILEEDRPRVLAGLEKQKLGSQTDIEYRIRQPNGAVRWIWDRAFPILDDEGKVTLVAGLVSDITERKQVTKNLQTQLERLKAMSAIDNAISTSMDIRLTLDIFIREAAAQLKVDAADVLLLNSSLLVLEYAAGIGFRSPHWGQDDLKLGEGLGGRVALKQQRIHIPNVANVEDEFAHFHLHQEEGFITYFGIPLIAKGQVKGVLEVYHRSALDPDDDWLDYLDSLAGQAAIAIEGAQLFENIQRSNFELIMAYDATIAGWSHAMDLRDKETEGHTQRVTEMTVQLAERMGVSKQEQVQMRRGALLHDIGKLGVPDHVLLKPGKLTEEEWARMRQHPTYAYEMLLPIRYLRPALDIPYCHHEKWDGSGYPRGLKGDGIPLSARIFAVVDVWDALRSDRPYRDGWSAQKTRDYILAESGKHFDPQVAAEFIKMLDEMSDVSKL